MGCDYAGIGVGIQIARRPLFSVRKFVVVSDPMCSDLFRIEIVLSLLYGAVDCLVKYVDKQ